MVDNGFAYEFDDAVDKLYVRHDGGQDTRKGVIRAADYVDYEMIPDRDAAAVLVNLDIYRGVPQGNDMFTFGANQLLAESAFKRMLRKAAGDGQDIISKIERSEGGITCGAALELVNKALGNQKLQDDIQADAALTRAEAVRIICNALKISDGSGEIPALFYVEENTTLTKLKLPEHTVIAGPDGKIVTLTVDGVFQPLVGGYEYKGDLRLTLTDRYELYRYKTAPQKPGAMPDEPSDLPDEPCYWNYFDEPYRAALFLENGQKVASRSIDSAYRVSENGGILIESDDAPSNAFAANNFNGIIIGGDQPRDYVLKNLKIRFNGNGMDDFQGMGAGILLCGDQTRTTIENADICNYGTVRTTMVVGGAAKVMVKNSRFETHDGIFEDGWIGGMAAKKMRTAPIWGGFEGNCRATNLLDKAEANYFESQIMAEKWGVLSTDNNKGCHSTAINSLVAITGGLNPKIDTSSYITARQTLESIPFSEIYGEIERDLGNQPCASHKHAGGYGTYSIGNTTVKFAGSTVIAADYANTCVNASAKVIYCASTPENLQGIYGTEKLEIKPQNTVVYSDKVGVMMQRGNGNGGVLIKDGTVFHCGCACFSVKSNGSFHIDVDHSTLISESGTIISMMDDDDTPRDITDPESPTTEALALARELVREGLLVLDKARKGKDVFASFSDMTVNGNCYNASGYLGAISREDFAPPKPGPGGPGGPGGFNPFAPRPKDCARNLQITLDNVQYNGIISTAEGHHIDRDTGRWLSPVPQSKWYCMAFLENVPRPAYQAGVILELKNGSVWNVTQTSYLTAITTDGTSTVHGKIFVDGIPVNPEAGKTYTGYITVQPGC